MTSARRVDSRARRLASGASLVIGCALACDRGEVSTSAASDELRCASISGVLPGTATFAECTDGRTRELSCLRSTPDEKDEDVFCACVVDQKMGASFMFFRQGFDASADPGAAIATGNRRCGWELAEPQ
jgi:hypothetical protein